MGTMDNGVGSQPFFFFHPPINYFRKSVRETIRIVMNGCIICLASCAGGVCAMVVCGWLVSF